VATLCGDSDLASILSFECPIDCPEQTGIWSGVESCVEASIVSVSLQIRNPCFS